MAILKDSINFTGSIGNMSAYKMKGHEGTILRSKGGPTKKQIRKSPKFEQTRKNNTEFTGSAKAVKSIRMTLLPVKHLADYNFTPLLTSLCKTIQKEDGVSKRGKRAVYLSQHRYLLEGFRFNKKHPFSNVVSNPLSCSIDRKKGSAVVQLPKLIPGRNLVMPWEYPLFRFIIVLGTATDISYNGLQYNEPDYGECPRTDLYTDWHMAEQPFAGQKLKLQLKNPEILDDTKTLILSVGIEMGTPVSDTYIRPVDYAGCAKILAVG